MPCEDIFDLPQCLLSLLTDFVMDMVNAPLSPFLQIVKMLLSQPANISALSAFWAAIVYILSAFYGIFIMFAGLNLLISNHSVYKRERAKEWLQNTLVMILLIQASYLLYAWVAQVASGLAAGVISFIDPNFFLITPDSALGFALQLVLSVVYLTVLIITIIALAINYFFASIGVVFFPIGIFLFYIPPLRDIGKFIISKTLFVLFTPFFVSILLFGVSILLRTTNLPSLKIFYMMGAFAAVNVFLLIVAILAVFRSVMGILHSDITRGMLFLKGVVTPKSAPQQMSEREYWSKPRTDYHPYGRRYR